MPTFKHVCTNECQDCIRCNGTGWLTWTERDDGICYGCHGSGHMKVKAMPTNLVKDTSVYNLKWCWDNGAVPD